MRVVSNTSPLSNLAIIGRLELLRERYGRVVLPPAVKAELDALSHNAGAVLLRAALAAGWVVVDPLPPGAPPFPERLDPGETEAVWLAEASRAEKLLMDDRLGRELARQRGLRVSGLLGELVFAKAVGRIASVREEVRRLRAEARFFLRPEVEALILAQAGE